MKCLIIFDHLNDILYSKYNKKFIKHILTLAKNEGLTENTQFAEKQDNLISPNIIMQFFSPIVTSHRIMSCQFGNSYTTVQCFHNINIAFEEYMGYLFIHIGAQSITYLKRTLSICVCLVRHLCGPDVTLLKHNINQASLLSRLLDTWIHLRDTDQAMLVEAVEQLVVNSDLGSATLKALQDAVEKMRNFNVTKVHAMILVQNKFLSLYSSRSAQDISAADVLFCILLCASNKSKDNRFETEINSDDSEEFFSPSTSPEEMQKNSSNKLKFDSNDITNYYVLLMSTGQIPACIPHAIYITTISEDVKLMLIHETGNSNISSGLYEAFHHLNVLQTVQMQKDGELLRLAFENLDMAIKKIIDAFKKIKNISRIIDTSQKKLALKWDFMKKKYTDLLKTGNLDCIVKIEASTLSFIETLRELLQFTVFDETDSYQSINHITEISLLVSKRLENYSDFLKVKAYRNFTLGSRASLTINKYLEEFPGLVHFLYIDRTNHRVTAPSFDFNSQETITLTKNKIWAMVEFSRKHLQDGHLAFMWKDTTFNYAYFLWFEDSSGSPLKPKVFPVTATKPLPPPGLLSGDFYRKLIEICFPKMSAAKIRCYELFCIHLGLATSSCVLEHTRRLAATIWDVTGMPNNPIDLL